MWASKFPTFLILNLGPAERKRFITKKGERKVHMRNKYQTTTAVDPNDNPRKIEYEKKLVMYDMKMLYEAFA